jgi:hypothetical protein
MVCNSFGIVFSTLVDKREIALAAVMLKFTLKNGCDPVHMNVIK